MGAREHGDVNNRRGSLRARVAVSLAWLAASAVLAIAAGTGIQSTGGLTVRIEAEQGLDGIARSVATDGGATSDFPGLGAPGEWVRDTVILFVLRDLSDLHEAGFGPPEPWVAGLADPPGHRVALRAGTELETLATLRAVYRHELAHLLVHEASGGAAPRWLHEGYAQFASGAWGWDDAWRIQLALFQGGSGSLRQIDLQFRSNSEDVRLAYLLSYTVVQELYNLGGEAGLEALFRSLREGNSLDLALRSIYGFTLEQFERRWRSTVMDRYGWLYLLSRAALFWFLITGFVLAVGVRRLRRDRRRLEEMRRLEQLTDSIEAFDVDSERFEG